MSTAPVAARAGASSSRTRSSITGTWPAAAVLIEPLFSVLRARGARPGRHPRSAGPGDDPRSPRRLTGSLSPGVGEVTSADESSGAGGDLAGHLSQNPWQHLLRRVRKRVFLFGQIGVPRDGVPYLKPGIGADHHAVALQGRVLAQRLRDRDPALLVRHLVRGAGEEDPAVVAHRLCRYGCGAKSLGNASELGLWEYIQAALLTLGQHQTVRQLIPVLRWQDHPALVVKPRSVGAEKHRPSPPLSPGPLRPTEGHGRALLLPTAHHCTPQSSTVNHLDGQEWVNCSTNQEVSCGGERWSSGAGGPVMNLVGENHVAADGAGEVTSGAHCREACYAVISNPLLLRRIAARTVKAHGMVVAGVAARRTRQPRIRYGLPGGPRLGTRRTSVNSDRAPGSYA